MKAVTILLLGIIAGANTEFPYSYTQLDDTGIIFEEVSKTLLYKDQWVIFTTVNMSRIKIWEDYLNWSENTITDLCDRHAKLGLNKTCQLQKASVHYTVSKIKLELHKIEINKADRRRRSIFDGVGKLSKFLFGTMDQEDADEIHSRLSNLEADDKQNLELIKEQVSIIKSNYEASSQVLDKFNKDLQEVKSYVSNVFTNINSTIASLHNETQKLQMQISLDEIASDIIVHLQEIEHQLENIYLIINTLNNKQLHPLILSYPQLADLAVELTASYPLNSALQNPFVLQQMALVESSFSQSNILCKITIPLVQKEWYSLKKIYPLPIPNNNYFVHYDIQEDYLLTDDGANRFIPAQQHHLESCKKLSLDVRNLISVCHLLQPLYTSPNDNCLLLLYKKWPEANKICKTSPIIQNHNTIIKMVTENSWLFLLVSEITVKIECPEFQTVIKFSKRGILNLKPNCQAKIDNILLPTTNTISRNVSIEQVDLIPRAEIQLEEFQLSNIQTNFSKTSIMLTNHENQNMYFREQNTKLNTFLQKIGSVENDREARHRNNTQLTHSFILVTIICLLVLIIIIAIVKYRHLRHHIKTPKLNFPSLRKSKNLATSPRNPICLPEFSREARSSAEKDTQESSTPPKLKVLIPERKSTKVNINDFEII